MGSQMSRYRDKYFNGSVPQCCTKQDFINWGKMAKLCKDDNIHFCDDCNKKYQESMISQDRCLNPYKIFEIKEIK